MQDPQPALATQQAAEEELQSTVVPFSLDKRPEGKRLIYNGRYSAPLPWETPVRPRHPNLLTQQMSGDERYELTVCWY